MNDPREEDPTLTVVETRTLDGIVEASALPRLDLVKLDLEGFEWPALKGAGRAIARFRPQVIFEYVEECSRRGGGTGEAVREFFQRHRYRLFAIGRNWSEAIDSRPWPSAANIWAIPMSTGEHGRIS